MTTGQRDKTQNACPDQVGEKSGLVKILPQVSLSKCLLSLLSPRLPPDMGKPGNTANQAIHSARACCPSLSPFRLSGADGSADGDGAGQRVARDCTTRCLRADEQLLRSRLIIRVGKTKAFDNPYPLCVLD